MLFDTRPSGLLWLEIYHQNTNSSPLQVPWADCRRGVNSYCWPTARPPGKYPLCPWPWQTWRHLWAPSSSRCTRYPASTWASRARCSRPSRWPAQQRQHPFRLRAHRAHRHQRHRRQQAARPPVPVHPARRCTHRAQAPPRPPLPTLASSSTPTSTRGSSVPPPGRGKAAPSNTTPPHRKCESCLASSPCARCVPVCGQCNEQTVPHLYSRNHVKGLRTAELHAALGNGTMSYVSISLQVNVSLCSDAESAPLPEMSIFGIWHPHIWNRLVFPTVICAQSPSSSVHKIMACLFATASDSLALLLRVDFNYRPMSHFRLHFVMTKNSFSLFSHHLVLDCRHQCAFVLHILSESMQLRCNSLKLKSNSTFWFFACAANALYKFSVMIIVWPLPLVKLWCPHRRGGNSCTNLSISIPVNLSLPHLPMWRDSVDYN